MLFLSAINFYNIKIKYSNIKKILNNQINGIKGN